MKSHDHWVESKKNRVGSHEERFRDLERESSKKTSLR